MNRLLEIDSRHVSDERLAFEHRSGDPLWVSRMNQGRIVDCEKLLADIKAGVASPLNEEEVLYLCQQIAAASPEAPPHWAL